MVLVSSTMLPLGTHAPDFRLKDTVSGHTLCLADFKAQKGLLVMFLCNHCPYVKHIQPGLVDLGRDYADKDLALVGISANDPLTHPGDAPDKLGEESKRLGYRFPMLFDGDQSVSKAYTASCTPDFFLFDGARRLAYRGQLDDSRPGNGKPVTGSDVRAALDAVLAGRSVAKDQRASIGCNIKWRAGNEPSYFGAR